MDLNPAEAPEPPPSHVSTTDVSTTESSRKSAGSGSDPMLYCPVCSLRLAERKCKLYCERCGYYMSCSDYY